MLVIYVSLFAFPPESSLFYIHMVIVTMGLCYLLVFVLGITIVLLRVTILHLIGQSISLSPVDCTTM